MFYCDRFSILIVVLDLQNFKIGSSPFFCGDQNGFVNIIIIDLYRWYDEGRYNGFSITFLHATLLTIKQQVASLLVYLSILKLLCLYLCQELALLKLSG